MSLTIEKLSDHIGAEVSGIDLTQGIGSDTIDALKSALDDHSVLVFRNQVFEDETQIAFSERWGPLETTVYKREGDGGVPVANITNVDFRTNTLFPPDHPRLKSNSGNEMWHTDSSFKPVPTYCSMLSGREVPPVGGNTEFASCRAAYEAMSAEERQSLEGLVAEHDYGYSRSLVDGYQTPQQTLDEVPPSGTRSYERIPGTAGRIFTRAHMPPTSSADRSKRDGSCFATSWLRQANSRSPTATNGGSSISSFGTIVAYCTARRRTMRPSTAVSCTARRLPASVQRSMRTVRRWLPLERKVAEMMSEFPPSPEAQVTLANWRTPPFHRWGFQHVREIVPTADIPASPSGSKPLVSAPVAFGSLEIDDGSGRHLHIEAFLAETSTDSIVVLTNEGIAFERYTNGMDLRTPHILMSVSKSILGLLAGLLTARGDIDLDKAVTDYVPEVTDTAFQGATLRHLLDMRVGIDFDEDYLATSGPIIAYRKSTNWNPLDEGEAETDLRSFFQTLRDRAGEHGGPTNYVSPNNDLMGWVMERASGRRYADLVSELLWQPAGTEDSAYITVDRLGAPRCAGGMCTTTRDLARIGQILACDGEWQGKTIVPKSWIDDIETGGDAKAWRNGTLVEYFPGFDITYRSQWYSLAGPTPLLFGFGVHGQFLFVDRNNRIAIAKFSSGDAPLDAEQISLSIRGAQAISRHLAG